jgi:hypothetical protein
MEAVAEFCTNGEIAQTRGVRGFHISAVLSIA